MAKLFPVFEVPKIMNTSQTDNRQRKSLYFDFEKGDFSLDIAGQIKTATPYDAWVQWCLKTIYTQRGALLAYSGQIGVEMEEALKQDDRAMQESYIERTVTEALLADPYQRTIRVYDFHFYWGVDNVEVTLVVSGIWDRDTTLHANLQKVR